MTAVMAVTGKGGTGKTTISALIIRHLVEMGAKPVLAVDADSNANLNMALGVPIDKTVGDLREDLSKRVQKQTLPAGMSKQDILEMEIEQATVETKDFDLLAMGRPEGPGCYCAINNMLRTFLDRISDRYQYVVVDNEAGMEHLSRRTTRGVSSMFVVSDPSVRGLETAARIRALAEEMDIGVENYWLVLSRVRGEMTAKLNEAASSTGMELGGVVPDDPEVARLDAEGTPLIELPDSSASYIAVGKIRKKALQGVS